MKKALIFLAAIGGLTAPAQATGGFVCRTAGAKPVEVSVGFGHVPGSPLIARQLVDEGRNVSVKDAQWWLDNDELRLVLVSPQGLREEVRVRARRNGQTYDGSLWRGGLQRWVRCREG